MGRLRVVLFSPEDRSIIKAPPSERRRFLDMELCQVDPLYFSQLSGYNRALLQRNKLLKSTGFGTDLGAALDVYDEQLLNYGKKLLARRKLFVRQLEEIAGVIHQKLTGDVENMKLSYEPNVSEEKYEETLFHARDRDISFRSTTVGPHRDDFRYEANGIDMRKFGSQGQQRTAALSLKLSELKLVEKLTGEKPVLLLDDVLSELDESRQTKLLESMGGIQTLITCTGVGDFLKSRLKINRIYQINRGKVAAMQDSQFFLNDRTKLAL